MKRMTFNSWVAHWTLEDRIINDAMRNHGIRAHKGKGYQDICYMTLRHDTLKTIEIYYYRIDTKYYFVYANYNGENWGTHGFRASLSSLVKAMYGEEL